MSQSSHEAVFNLSVLRHLRQNLQRLRRRSRGLIGALFNERTVGITNGENSAQIIYLLPLQAIRITAAIEILMMMAHGVQNFGASQNLTDSAMMRR
jgi:hypothetical protein